MELGNEELDIICGCFDKERPLKYGENDVNFIYKIGFFI